MTFNFTENTMKKLFLLTTLALFCSSASGTNDTVVLGGNGLPESQTKLNSHKEVLWFQHAVERKAIGREVFLEAENSIKQQIISQKLQPKEWGVIIDIDETLLDNSEWNYQHSIYHSKQTWDQFAALAKSTVMPGAAEFTHHIHQMGGYVNLVSNRNAELLKSTQYNLKSQHIYYDQLLLDATKQGTSFVDKNSRFNAIKKGELPSELPPQKIIAWLGDNIQDFPDLKQRNLAKNPNNIPYNSFGKIYFVFPNPMYGSWES
jgi:5'-nucleotidase (lipoprotein e(P4) family)